MKTYNSYLFLIAVLLLFFSCKKKDTEEVCEINIDTIDFSFGIDYKNTHKYLIPGEESDLSEVYLVEIRNAVGIPGNSIDSILLVCHWINRNFSYENAGGSMTGVNTAD